MVKMIESAEEFATLKKGDKPVRSPRPDAASPLFFTAPGLKNLITMPRGTRSPHPHHPDRTRAISRGPSHRAESSVQARGTRRGTRDPADLTSPRHPFSKAMQTLARFFLFDRTASSMSIYIRNLTATHHPPIIHPCPGPRRLHRVLVRPMQEDRPLLRGTRHQVHRRHLRQDRRGRPRRRRRGVRHLRHAHLPAVLQRRQGAGDDRCRRDEARRHGRRRRRHVRREREERRSRLASVVVPG